jgi:hypothetical protein
MSASSQAFSDSLQSRLESISMRLDAATDNLLQTRDLIIRHLEHQMLQLQEVRGALHETATETGLWAQQMTSATPAAPPPPQPAIKLTGGLTLESLFAPLNAGPRTPTAPIVDVVEQTPDPAIDDPASGMTAEILFETEPAGGWDAPEKEVFQPAQTSAPASPSPVAMDLKPLTQVLTASHNDIDPALEKATLDELNEALTRAFAQIANRNASR